MTFKLQLQFLPFRFLQIRNYRPAVSPEHQEKILFIRSELASQGVATGRSRAKRNGLTGTEITGVSMKEAIERLREADKERMKKAGEENRQGHNSLLMNVKVKLLKEQ